MKLHCLQFTFLILVACAACSHSDPPPTPAPLASPINASDDHNNATGRHDPHSSSTSGSGAASNSGTIQNNSGSTAGVDSNTRGQLIALGSGDPLAIKKASEFFATSYNDGGRAIFARHLNDADATVRKGALWGVLVGATGGFDTTSEAQIVAQQAALKDEEAGVRHVALEAISNLKDHSFAKFIDVGQIARFVDDAHEPDADNRALAARMLSRLGLLGTAAQPALPALNEAIQHDPNPDVRTACLHAIYNIARTAEEALPGPTYVLQHDEDPRLRRIAANRLGSYKAASAPAIPQLIAALADLGVPQRTADDPLRGADSPVCIAAANALARVGKPAVGPLMQSLDSEDREVRLLSIRALGDIGPPAKEATSRLRQLAQSANAGEATAAKAALIRILGP